MSQRASVEGLHLFSNSNSISSLNRNDFKCCQYLIITLYKRSDEMAVSSDFDRTKSKFSRRFENNVVLTKGMCSISARLDK